MWEPQEGFLAEAKLHRVLTTTTSFAAHGAHKNSSPLYTQSKPARGRISGAAVEFAPVLA